MERTLKPIIVEKELADVLDKINSDSNLRERYFKNELFFEDEFLVLNKLTEEELTICMMLGYEALRLNQRL